MPKSLTRRDRPFGLRPGGKTSGFWWSDGSYTEIDGALKHYALFARLQKRGVVTEKLGHPVETLEELWDAGVVRVHLGPSELMPGLSILSIQGHREAVEARIRECASWVGPDGTRLFKTRMDIIRPGTLTDEDYIEFVGNLREGLAWLLLDCPEKATGSTHGRRLARKLTDTEIRAALNRAGITEWL